MSEPFRTRTFKPVAAQLRSWKHRRAARVVVLCEEAVLMLADTDPGIPGSRWWVTPGGGIEPGESRAETAIRELAEETGLKVDPKDLIGPVAVREVIHGFSDQILAQHESFFVAKLGERFDPSSDSLTADERITLDGWAWLPLAELCNQVEPVWPGNLLELVTLADQPNQWPRDLGVIEESTLPVG